MSGAHTQLDAGGTFTQDPDYTLFSKNYQPREVYLAESFEIPFDRSKPDFGSSVSAQVPAKGDIFRRATVRSKLPELYTPLGPGYVYPQYTDQVDGNVYVLTNTLAIQPGDFFGYFNTQFANAWATNFVGYTNMYVLYDNSTLKFTFYSTAYSNIFFKNESSAAFWGFDYRSYDFLTPTGNFPAYNFKNGKLTAQLTVVQGGWIRGFTPPPSTGFSYADSVGTRLIKEARLIIGGQTIDRLSSERLYLEDDLGIPYENQAGLTILEGKNDSSAVYAPREYYTRLTFNTDALNLTQMYRQDVRIEVDYEKFENLPSTYITSNSLVDGNSYRNTNWINTVQAYYKNPIWGITAYKKYIVFSTTARTATFNNNGPRKYSFVFYDTTKDASLSSSYTYWNDPDTYGGYSSITFTVLNGIIFYSVSSTISYVYYVNINDILSNPATATKVVNGVPFAMYKNILVHSLTSDARYVYTGFSGIINTIGSNSMTLYSAWPDGGTSANIIATYNVFNIATTALTASDNTNFINFLTTNAPSYGGINKTVTITDETKIYGNVSVTANVAYTYANNEPAVQTIKNFLLWKTTEIVGRFDTTTRTWDYLSWAGTGAPKTWFDIGVRYEQSFDHVYLTFDGRYLYRSSPEAAFTYLEKIDTQSFLDSTSYTFYNVTSISPYIYISANQNLKSDGQYLYFFGNVNSGVLRIGYYDGTRVLSDAGAYSIITIQTGTLFPSGYGLSPVCFDGKHMYYIGGNDKTYNIAMSIFRIDTTTKTLKDWIIWNYSTLDARTSTGLTVKMPQLYAYNFTLSTGEYTSSILNAAVGSRYIYIMETGNAGLFNTSPDLIQFDPLTMTPSLTSSLIVKYEKYTKEPTFNKSLYGQSDVEQFIFRKGYITERYKLRFVGPVREVWISIDSPGVISRVILLLNNEVLVDDDKVTSRFIRPFETHTCMPTSNVCMYSISIDPERNVPSGTLNFSRIAYPELELTLESRPTSDLNIRVHSKSFNVLGTQNGVGGLLFNSAF